MGRPVFLATTTLSDYWDKGQETLFLSAACLRYDRRDDWESLKYQVMPSPWDDRNRFYQATRYLDEYYERLLVHFAGYLNDIHGVGHGQRYWRILVGPWIFHFLHAAYDRYIHLIDAFTKFPNLDTKVLDPASYRTPKGVMELFNWAAGDAYNLQLYSQILAGLGYSFPAQPFPNGWPETDDSLARADHRFDGSVKNRARWGLKLVAKGVTRALSSRQQIGFHNLSLPASQSWRLAWQMGLRASEIVLPAKWSFTLGEPAFGQDRNGLSDLDSTQDFERVFAQALPQNFPVLYLEAYREAQSELLRERSKIPDVLVSCTGWLYDEPFKFLAAEAVERGSRLVAAQHGGAYGLHRYQVSEQHEIRLSDSFLVWGWAGSKDQGLQNQPSPGLSALTANGINNRPSKKAESILFVGTANPRYFCRFHSTPVGAQWGDYFDWQLRFFDEVSERVRRRIRFRAYAEDFSWHVQKRVSDRFPDLLLEDGRPMNKRINESRLVVIDHSMTTMLEAFVSNVPTILFWDPQRWEARDEAEPYFAGLRRVGILWDSPEEAASKLEAVYDEPWAWWGSKEVQDVRQGFAERYAYTRKDWARCWAEALKREVALSQANVK